MTISSNLAVAFAVCNSINQHFPPVSGHKCSPL
jgi:hypothetical protein